MKKIGKVIASLLLVGSIAFFMVSCQTDKPPVEEPPITPPAPTLKKAISSVQLNTTNAKRSYFLGEEFSSTNLVVIARFNDGTSEDVSSDAEINYESFDNEVVGSYPIIVSYTFEGRVKRNSYEVQVTSLAETIEPHVVGLEVEKRNTSYAINSTVDVSDISVTAVFSDDTTQELTSEEYKVDFTTVDTTKPNIYPLVISYSQEYSVGEAKETVVVKNFVLITITDPVKSISFVSGKTEFEYGSRFSTDDWIIEVTYESGAKAEVSNDKFRYTTIDTFSAGSKTVRVTYSEMGSAQAIRVDVTVLPNPQGEYQIDKKIVATDLKVTDATIASNHKQEMTASEIDEFFTISGSLLKYLNSSHTQVRSVEAAPGNSIQFTIEGTAKLTIIASSNGSSNTSLLSVTNEAGELQDPITPTVAKTSTGLVSILGSSDGTTVEYSLTAGTYFIAFVSGIDDSTNVANATTISNTRAGRITSLVVKA
ncbi:MAG: bacterial Ig-like domain-containing protein [Anaeroplasmataceae bacterium]|nr:bacterial Ig-like domain-containing protein [Anaeroplasmataceae bacterium]